MLIAKEDSFVLDKEPESKIIGKFVILVPFSNLNMEVYVTKEERLTPLNDAVLRIYALENQNFNIEETSEILGVSISDVENSYYRLLEKDLIDFVTKRITDDGRKYITERKAINRLKERFSLIVNKITGEVSYQEEGAFIRFKDKRKSSHLTPYERNKDIILEESITLNRVQKIWNYRKEFDEIRYQGELIELLNSHEKGTVYKKFNIYYFMNKQNNVEIRAYERNNRDKLLEQFIRNQESANCRLTKSEYDYFFEKNVGTKTKNIVDSYEQIEFTKDGFKSFEFLDKAIRSIDIYLPLNSFLYIEEDFIYHIGKQANTEKLINIYFSGIEPITIKQRSTIEKITKLTNSNKRIKVFSINKYCPQTVILDNKSGKIIYPKIIPINLEGTESKCVYLEFKEIDSQEIEYIQQHVASSAIDLMDIPQHFELNEVTKKIYKLIEELDELFANKGYGYGWLAHSNATEIEKLLLGATITKKNATFESFTTKLSAKMVENFKDSTKKARDKNYFDKQFPIDWPELSLALNRIRVYRNSYSHDFLNKFFLTISEEIILMDFSEYCPSGISNTCEYKQYVMVEGLYIALQETIKKLNQKETPF